MRAIVTQGSHEIVHPALKTCRNSLDAMRGASAADFIAYQSIDLSVGIPTNLEVRPGDIIYVNLPEFHGFNESTVDRYVTGYFLVSEVKTVMRTSGETSTLLRINKDSLLNSILDKSLYTPD